MVECVTPSWYCVTEKNFAQPWHFNLPSMETAAPERIPFPSHQSSKPS